MLRRSFVGGAVVALAFAIGTGLGRRPWGFDECASRLGRLARHCSCRHHCCCRIRHRKQPVGEGAASCVPVAAPVSPETSFTSLAHVQFGFGEAPPALQLQNFGDLGLWQLCTKPANGSMHCDGVRGVGGALCVKPLTCCASPVCCPLQCAPCPTSTTQCSRSTACGWTR